MLSIGTDTGIGATLLESLIVGFLMYLIIAKVVVNKELATSFHILFTSMPLIV